AAAVREFRARLEAAQTEVEKDASRYGLALAYLDNEQYALAHETLDPLLNKEPNRITYVVTKADIHTAGNEPALAQSVLARHLQINPSNHPLTMAQADALIAARDYTAAMQLLEKHVQSRPEDHDLWYLIAETQGMAGDI